MTVVSKKAVLPQKPEQVWAVVTDLKNFYWRSDLDRIEITKECREFVEYTRDGFATRFRITAYEPCKRYEFDMENENMSGHWTGLFSKVPEGTEIVFTEDITAKKAVMKPLVGIYLKKQQNRYIEDLKRAFK